MKKRWIVVIVIIAILFLAPLVVAIIFPWTGINCKHQDINIKTGQIRYTRSLWFMTISERVEETILSKAMEGHIVDVADIKPWHRVNTFSPYLNNSPHYIFHSALSQINQIKQSGVCT